MEQISVRPETVPEPWKEDGPLLLLAGPGTGKTHQLALRIKYLVEEKHVPPESITVITFTKEAADNMRRRISDQEKADVYLVPDRRPVRIKTMHSLGLEIVRESAKDLNLPDDFGVVTDMTLRRLLFRDAAFLCGCGELDAERAYDIRQKTMTPPPDAAETKIVREYEAILRANRAIDYDDQILLASQVLLQDDRARSRYGEAARHLLIDEYQDINPGQRELVALLSKDHLNGLFVVGDDDQSIYSFRGGTPKYIRAFASEYGEEAGVHYLVESRRCPDKVMHAALNVVSKFDQSRISKPEPTFREEKKNAEPVVIHDVASDRQEAELISNIVKQALPNKSVLVLVPTRNYVGKIKHALRKNRIECSHPAPTDASGFEILQVVDDWIDEPTNNFALRLCLEYICEAGEVAPSSRMRSPALKEERRKAMAAIASLWRRVVNDGCSLWEALERRKAEVALLGNLHAKLSALGQLGAANVSEFMSSVISDLGLWPNREALMKELRSWTEEVRSHGRNAEGSVRILTFQAAKGLEADVVCIVGLDEGVLPRAGAGQTDVEENARLVYVSMTRAKKELHLFHARIRDASATFMKESYMLKPSRYVKAISGAHGRAHFHPAPSRPKKGKS